MGCRVALHATKKKKTKTRNKKTKRIKKLGATDFLWGVNIECDDVDHENRN